MWGLTPPLPAVTFNPTNMKSVCPLTRYRSCGMLNMLGILLILLVCSCTQAPKDHLQIRRYLNSHYAGISYKLLVVNEPDSAYSPLNTLLEMRHYLTNLNNNFEKGHMHIIRDDITNNDWSTDLYQLVIRSDSLAESYYRKGMQSMENYKLPRQKQPKPNAKIIKATLVFNGDTVNGQFYCGRDNETITHCIRSLDAFEEDLSSEYRRWLRLKTDAQQDLEHLSAYTFE